MLLTPAEYTATAEKIDKLNARAVKRGWTGTVKLTGAWVEKTHVNPMTGMKVTQQMVEAEITGEPPKYEGWTFLARAEIDNDSGLVVYGAPGACPVDRDAIRPDECDHCNIKRYRKNIYIVSKGERQMQVGSTCLKDFLGWSINPVWISTDLRDYVEDGGWGHFEPTYSTETVLATAWATIQQYGYVKSDDWNRNPTKYAVHSVLDPRNDEDRIIASEVMPHIPGAEAQAKVIREWVLAQPDGNGDYMPNLKNIARGDFVSFKKFGFLVSAPQAWARAQERDLIRRTEQGNVVNEWTGTKGDMLEVSVVLKSIRDIPGDWGTSHLYTFEGTEDHKVYKWFSSRVIFDGVDGKPVTLRGRIGKHDEYQGRRSTVLARCKVI